MPVQAIFRGIFSPDGGDFSRGTGRDRHGETISTKDREKGTLVKLICLTNKPVQSVNRQGKQAGRAGRQANREKAT